MKTALFFLSIFLLISCKDERPAYPPAGFPDRIVDFAIRYGDGRYIELPDLYDRFAENIPNIENDATTFGDKLTARGFQETDRKRSIFQLSEKLIHTFIFAKDNCRCEIEKEYGETGYLNRYSRTERIRCSFNDTTRQISN